MITAPYNFVPLSDKVFFPPWADQVSHDIPFSDGESGEIEVTITAKSPIFIRGHENKEEFCNHNGTYYLPGSSVKGMVRNVLEIMSFSKMKFADDDTYAVRDLRNRDLYMYRMTPEKIHCGWLKKTADGYIIEDCGKPGRIKHEEIDKIFNINFASRFKAGTFGDKASDKTAEKKYNLLPEKSSMVHSFSYLKKDIAKREIYRYDKNGSKKGTLVFTGQPSARKEPADKKASGKVYEFVFFEKISDLKVSPKSMKDFLFAYFDGRTTEPKKSTDWKYWEQKLNDASLPEEERKIPVFFQKSGLEILHFGLSYLYKLPYNHSVRGGIPPVHKDSRNDLAEILFGYIDDKKSLKGRVQFSHFVATDSCEELDEKMEVLGTPRASYYPNYVRQEDGKLFATFMDPSFSISGWKRYPVHKTIQSYPLPTSKDGEVNMKVVTVFTPLNAGAVFAGKIRYHNLRRSELGALLSALTFHDIPGCYHSIGMAKSLGYGKIALTISGIETRSYLKDFETEITSSIPGWSQSEQLTELLSMATEQDNKDNSELRYMKLEEFAANKTGNKDYLRNYTALKNIRSVSPTSLLSADEAEALKPIQAQRAQEEQEWLAQEQEWQIAKDSTSLDTLKSFIDRHPDSPHAPRASRMIANIEKAKEDEETFLKEQEASQKWDAVQKVETKYKQKALEDFIDKYAYSLLAQKAEKELAELVSTHLKKTATFDFGQADDAKSIERVIKSITNPSENDKQRLEETINRVYPKLNAKKKKQFTKSKLMARWFGSNRLNEIITRVTEEQKHFVKSDFDILQSLRDDGINADGE
jgi:CRISPR-associated protein (TIGR03986 family)